LRGKGGTTRDFIRHWLVSAEGGVTMDSSGDLFGTTTYAGGHDVGTVWELAAGSQTITTLASFDLTNGGNPEGGVTDARAHCSQ
jgi:uncharacterized repeat protein (TIGR03803 family)